MRARGRNPRRRTASACILLSLGAVIAASCRAPTEVMFVISTDVKCADLRGTSVSVGRLGEIETMPATSSSTFCDESSGGLGTLVVVPSGGKGDEVAMKIVAGFVRDPGTCLPPYGKGCIVARRALRYVPHTPLRIAVPLRAACDGVPCGETETCVSGVCEGATIADSSACGGAGGCDEGALGPVPVADGGGDGAPSAPAYHDVRDSSFWSTFDVKIVSPGAAGFAGSVFDGRYVYFVPSANATGFDGVVVRYDSQAPFTTAASWAVFDITTVNAAAKGLFGGAYDGRYVHLVPNFNGAEDGLAARLDTQAPFAASTSWATFDTATVSSAATGFVGAAFDGRYVYLVPNGGGVVARNDTQAPFTTAASWTTFDMTTVDQRAADFFGASFDGRYVYFAPYGNRPVARYDTRAPFASGGSWSTFDPASLGVGAVGFAGAAFDGRFVYFVPYFDGVRYGGRVMRYDTQAPFAAVGSWSTFDATTVNASARAFWGAAFDGRYVYFVPFQNESTFHGMLARYDTGQPFDTGASWTAFDMTTLNAAAKGFIGAAFDGRYVYFVPNGSVVARFDAKTPPSMPRLPGFSGSFL